jgi:uncharacterized protein (DUF362 family)
MWCILTLGACALLTWDIATTVAERKNPNIEPERVDALYRARPAQNPVVGICQSTDAALGGLAAPLSVDLTYEQVDSITRLAVQRAGGLADIVQPGEWVVIKPNILAVPGVPGMTWQHRGTVTDLRVVKSMIEQLIEEGDAARITVAEGKVWRKLGQPETPIDQTEDGWTYHWAWYGNLSYVDMLSELDAATPSIVIDYVDLDYPPYTPGVPVPGGGFSSAAYTVPNVILNCDKLIAIAVMKTHSLARVTLTSKLYIGTSPASVYRTGYWDHFGVNHDLLDRTIVDLMSFHPPDFGMVECFWGTEGAGPLGGSEIRRNVVLAGKDPVAVDASSAYSMGFNPWDIDYLHWAHYKGFGINNIDFIDINGPALNSIRFNFAKAMGQGRGNRTWLVNGTHSGSNINIDYLGGLERTISPLEGQSTSGRTWTLFSDITDYMDLADHFGAPSGCVAYAFTRIVADSAMTVRLRFGSDDGIKIWLNGDSLYCNPSTGGWSAVETDLPITLQPGVNRLLIKVLNTAGAYGFSTYVCETDGDTPLGIEFTTLSGAVPEVTLNAPPDGYLATDTSVVLSASVTDAENDPMTVTFYCDQVDASSPIYVQENVPAGSTLNYGFTRPVLQPDAATVGLWHFDEGSGGILHDASGNGQHGYWHCDSTLDQMWDTDGPFGHALHFSGYRTPTPDNPCAADYVEIPDNAGLDVAPAGQITIEFWVKPDYLPAPGERYWGIVAKRVPCTGADTNLCAGNPANYEVFFNHPTQTIGFYGNTTLNVSTCSLTVGAWQYIAVTVDGPTGRLRFYKNGALVHQMTGYIGNHVDGPLRIGASAYRQKGVDGVLDEVRISRRELDSAEIAQNFRRATGMHYWKVTAADGSGTTTSATRQFTIEASGPDVQPPVVTLVSPSDGAVTTNPFMNLSADVSDEFPTTARIYGGTTPVPTHLLHVQDGLSGTQTVNYSWREQPLTPDLSTMGLWHFDEGTGGTAADDGSDVNNGYLAGSAVWTDAGHFGYALDLNGVSGYINVPDDPGLDINPATGAITMEMWLYPRSIPSSFRTLIGKWAGSTNINYQISLDNQNRLLYYRGTWPTLYTSDIVLPLNQWSYIAVTLDAADGVVHFYRNGVEGAPVSSASFGPANTAPLVIGQNGNNSEFFDGLVDEVRVSRRALTSSEIAANYTLGGDTYYWRVMADDGTNPVTESQVRSFTITTGGPDTDPPSITLNAPTDGGTTVDPFMTLSTTVSDASPPVTVRIYGDRTASPARLLHVEENVAGLATLNYDWTAPVLQPEVPHTRGLWPFDENSGTTVADAGSNGNTGTLVGGPAWTSSGRFGYALDFNGSSAYVTVPDQPSLDIDAGTGAVTLEAWIYPHSRGGGIYRSIIAKRGFGTGGGPCNYQISLSNTSGNLLFYNGSTIYTSAVSVPINVWSYVAVTLSAAEGRLRFYRNGAILDSISGATFGAAHNYPLYIGVANQVSECFDGLMDEVRVSGRALSPTEIAANYKLSNGTYYWKVTATDAQSHSAAEGPRSFTVNTSGAPAVPVLIAPASGTVTNDNTPTFQWTSTAGSGGTYTLQYATNTAFTTGVVTVSGLGGTSYTVPSILQDNTYYWHVQAFTSQGDSSGYQVTPFSLTVDAVVSGVPVLISPADLALTADNTPKFEWSRTAGVGGTYTLQYATNVGFTTGLVTVPGVGDTTWTVAGSLADNTYYWRVQAKGSGGDSSGYQATPYSFTVDTQAPVPPTLISPPNLAVIGDATPTFAWSASAGPGGTYTLQYATDPAFTFVVTVVGFPDTTYEVPMALMEHDYYWHVSAKDQAGNEGGYQASPSRFTLDLNPAAVPILMAPPDSSFTPDRTPTFVWNSPVSISAAPPFGGYGIAGVAAVSYRLQYGSDSTFAVATTVAGVTDTTYTIEGTAPLEYTTCYWRVEAVDGGGHRSGYQARPFQLGIFKAGDQNMDGVVTSSDVIYLVNYVFKGGSTPLPCRAAGDLNCDGVVTSSDIIYIVNFVFKGGAAPCDLGTLIEHGTWSCP